MIAPGFAGLEEQLWLWLFAMIRPGAAFFAAPVTGAKIVPVQLRLIISLAVGIAAIGGSGLTLPQDGLISISGFALIAGEVVIGLAIGFTVQIGYAAAFVAGETISNAMGLGFASMSDPQTGQSTPVIGQFLSIIATLIFLAMDGHLILASIIVRSYDTLPPGSGLLSADAALRLAHFVSANAHELITILFEELLNLLDEIHVIYARRETQDIADQQAIALTIVDSLIISLDMEKGGGLAKNLHQLYGQVRQLIAARELDNRSENNRAAHQIISEIFSAWSQIGR